MEIIRKLHITHILLPLLCLFSISMSAQTAGDKVKKAEKGKGSVTVTQSADIDALVNRAKLTSTPQDNKGKKDNSQAVQETATQTGTVTVQQPQGTSAEAPETDEALVETRKPAVRLDEDRIHLSEDFNPEAAEKVTGPKIMRGTRTVRGYRIQVYAGTSRGQDRKNAEQACRTIKNRYPSLPVYVHFLSPRWICQCGNFHKHKEAQDFLKKIQKLGFPKASIVRSPIMVNSSDRLYRKYKKEHNDNNDEEN